jgi:electron transfer flavoprotein alpha subunit
VSILIVAEQQPDGHLRKATLHAIAAAKQLAQVAPGELHIAVLAKDAQALASELKQYGAARVHAISSPEFEHYVAEAFAPTVAALATSLSAKFVGMGSTAMGKDLIPRVAAKLKAATATDVMKFEKSGDGVAFTRPMWAGNVIAQVKLKTPICAFTVRTTEFPPADKGGAEAPVVTAPATLEPSQTKFVEFKEVKSARPQLTEARVVISGGRGTKGDFKEIEALADELGAAVGASRAVCDAGWVPNDLQVGQTGKVVAPQLYIAAGISGAIQHLAGMKGSKVIVAINKDPEAPIFQVADYGLVADLFKALPELREALRARK